MAQPSTMLHSPMAVTSKMVVVIPALNEEAGLPDVLIRLGRIGLNRIRVVDNGSSDRTAEVARQCGAEVIRESRRGYGQACWTGCQNLPGDVNWILFCNADGSDDIERVPAMMNATGESAELILGSRLNESNGEHLTAAQRFGNRLATALMRFLWRANYTDFGPLRLISRRTFERLNLRDRGFGWTVEMQVRAAEEGIKFRELPVQNFPRSAGVSKISGTVCAGMRCMKPPIPRRSSLPQTASCASRTSAIRTATASVQPPRWMLYMH